jgi:hypothetical protein
MERRPTSRAITKRQGSAKLCQIALWHNARIWPTGMHVTVSEARRFRRKALRGSYGGSTVYGKMMKRYDAFDVGRRVRRW